MPESDCEPGGDAQARRRFSPHAVHLLRTAQMNTLTLARMADHKASILLGATFVVFSLSIGRALTGQMPISLTLLATFSFLSSLCAVMAVMPSVSRPAASKNASNLLFFGHFAWMDEDEWTDELLGRMETDDGVFRTMAHDMYQNGRVLQAKKYKYLALAYKMFVGGLTVTLIAFAIEMFAV